MPRPHAVPHMQSICQGSPAQHMYLRILLVRYPCCSIPPTKLVPYSHLLFYVQMSELEQHCVKYLLNLAKSDHAGDALRVGTYQLAHDLNKLQLQQQIALHIAASCHLTSSSGITALHGILSSPPYDTDTHQLLQLLQQSRVEAWGPTGPHITSVEVIMQLQQQGVIAACDYLLDAVAWRELSALEIKTAAR